MQIIKCTDRTCCKETRSSLRALIPNGFLPPPYPILQTSSGLTVPAFDAKKELKFSPFLIRLKTDTQPEHKDYDTIPYDLYGPSVQKSLKTRFCSFCQKYFTSKKNVENHKKIIHSFATQSNQEKIEPKKIFQKRGNEILCKFDIDTEEVIEWLDEEDVIVPEKWDLPSTEYLEKLVEEKLEDFPIVKDVGKWLKSDFEDLESDYIDL